MKTAAYQAASVFFGIVLVCLALSIPTGDWPTKWLYATLYAAVGFMLLLATALNSRFMMQLCTLLAALAFVLLWLFVVFAPKEVYGILFEYRVHVHFVAIISSIHLFAAIFAYFASNHMFKKEP